METKIKFYSYRINEIFKFISKVKFAKVKNNTNVLIYGISRGGTTLLAETLTEILKARLIWEPLFNHRNVRFNAINPYSLKTYKELSLGWHPHIESENDKEANDYFDDYFALKKRNIRFFRYTDIKSFSESEFTIHKMCFGDFMYPYFQKRYKLKSIVLLRHPFAIAASSLNFGNNFDYHKNYFAEWKYKDSAKSGSFFSRFENKYDLIVSGFAYLVFQTVSQFAYILENYDRDNSVIVFYENLVINKKQSHFQLETFFDRPIDYAIFEKLLSKQSFSSDANHTEMDALAQLSKWKKGVSQKDINDGLKIFSAFNFKLYSEDILPNTVEYDAFIKN